MYFEKYFGIDREIFQNTAVDDSTSNFQYDDKGYQF